MEEKINKLPYKHYRPSELGKIKGNHRYRILMINKQLNPLINDIWIIIDEYLKENKMARIKIDIDPLYLE